MMYNQRHFHLYYDTPQKDSVLSRILRDNNRFILTLYLFEFGMFKYSLAIHRYEKIFLLFEKRFAEKYLNEKEDGHQFWDASDKELCGISWSETNSGPLLEVILHFRVSDRLILRMSEVFNVQLRLLLALVEINKGVVFYEQ